MELVNAITMQGPLQKQSPSFLKLFQSRYFAVRGKGEFLVWFKKKPINTDQNPQGIINIDMISECSPTSDDERTFTIIYLERQFLLRAESQDLRDRWVGAVTTIMQHQKKLSKNKKKNLNQTPQSWRWNSSANKEISEQIRIQNEQVILQQEDSNIYQKSDTFLSQLMKSKPILEAEKCIVHGLFSKKGILSDTQRWFILVSQFNMTDENDEEFYKSSSKVLQTLNIEAEKQREEERKMVQNSSDEESQKSEEDKDKYKINTIYEFDIQTKKIKHFYPLMSVISWESQVNDHPFELKIKYEQIINEEEEEIQQKQITLINQYLTQVKRWEMALKIIYQRYGIEKQRENIVNKRSKRYNGKKWKYVDSQEWILPAQQKHLIILLNKKFLKVNNISFMLEEIQQYKVDTLVSGQTKITVYLITTKQVQIQILFQNDEIMKKFEKRLTKNIKKVISELKKPQKIDIAQDEKIDHHTYYIKKKVRQTQNSIKVNFYERMEGDLIEERIQKDPNIQKKKSFFEMIASMFCGQGSSHDKV